MLRPAMGKKRGSNGPLVPQNNPDRLGAAELIALIKRVNPTDRNLPASERERRYREKSALQSTLIRRFVSDLAIDPDQGNPDLVLIRNVALGLQCGHALLSALEEDAASWVRMQQDLGSGAQDARDDTPAAGVVERDAGHEPEGESPEALLKQGAAALEEYDYDRARELLTNAFEMTGGAEPAARALLELLVDTLGADEDALLLEEQLSDGARTEPAVRVLLAQGCARTGMAEQAIRWLRGVELPRAAELLGQVAVASAEQGHTDLAETAMVQLRLRAPAHPMLATARRLLQESRALARAPEEEAIRTLLQEGALEEAESKARELLVRFPDSDVARSALARAEQERRTHRAQDTLLRARELAVESEPEQVAALAREVIATGTSDENVLREARELLASAQARAREAQLARKVDRVAAMLSEGASEAALLAWCELPADAREAVGTRCPMEVLQWLEPALEARGASPRRVVQAARHVAGIAHLAATDPERFVESLGGHEQLLAGVEPVVRLVAGARKAREERLASRSREALLRARELLAQGQLDAAKQAADSVEEQRLSPADRVASDELQRALQEQWERSQQLRQFEEESNPLTAIAMALQHAESRADEGERRGWSERASARRAKLESDWRVTRFGQEAAGEWLSLLEIECVTQISKRCLRAGGGAAVLGNILGDRLVAVEVDTASSQVLSGVTFRLPEHVDGLSDLVVEGDHVWVLGGDGCAVQLRLPGWELVALWRGDELNPRRESIERITLLPGGRTFATETFVGKRGSQGITLVDVSKHEGRRNLDGSGPLVVLPGSDPPRSLVRRKDETLSAIDARGALLQENRIGLDRFPIAAAIAPDKCGFVVAVPDEGGFEAESAPHLVVFDGARKRCQDLVIEDASSEGGVSLATSLDHRMLFCLVDVVSDEPELIGYRWESGRLSLAYRVKAPDGVVLVQDEESRRVTASFVRDGVARFVELGTASPTLPTGRSLDRDPLPNLGPNHVSCQLDDPTFESLTTGYYEELRSMRFKEQNQAIRGARRPERDVEDLMAFKSALAYLGRFDDEESLAEWLREQHGDHPLVRFITAQRALTRAAWSTVQSELQGLDPLLLPATRRRHFHHMLGMALAAARQPKDAVREFERAAAHPGACMLTPWMDALRIPSEVQDSDDATGSPSFVSSIVRALWATHGCLQRGDLDGALAAVDRRELWCNGELQSAAWIARVLLARAEAGKNDGVRATIGLALLVSFSGTRPDFTRSMPLPNEILLSSEQIVEIAARARAVLDR